MANTPGATPLLLLFAPRTSQDTLRGQYNCHQSIAETSTGPRIPTVTAYTADANTRMTLSEDSPIKDHPIIPIEAAMSGEGDFGMRNSDFEDKDDDIDLVSPLWPGISETRSIDYQPVAPLASSQLNNQPTSYFALPASISYIPEQQTWPNPIRRISLQSSESSSTHLTSPAFASAGSLSPPAYLASSSSTSQMQYPLVPQDAEVAFAPHTQFHNLSSMMTRSPGSSEGHTQERQEDAVTETPACDLCRKRKVKCDRRKPVCTFCAHRGASCTNDDQPKKRGPVTKAQRQQLADAGFHYDRKQRRWRKLEAGETVPLSR